MRTNEAVKEAAYQGISEEDEDIMSKSLLEFWRRTAKENQSQ